MQLPEALALEEARLLVAARAQLGRLLLRRLADVDTRKLHQCDARHGRRLSRTGWVDWLDAREPPLPAAGHSRMRDAAWATSFQDPSGIHSTRMLGILLRS